MYWIVGMDRSDRIETINALSIPHKYFSDLLSCCRGDGVRIGGDLRGLLGLDARSRKLLHPRESRPTKKVPPWDLQGYLTYKTSTPP